MITMTTLFNVCFNEMIMVQKNCKSALVAFTESKGGEYRMDTDKVDYDLQVCIDGTFYAFGGLRLVDDYLYVICYELSDNSFDVNIDDEHEFLMFDSNAFDILDIIRDVEDELD